MFQLKKNISFVNWMLRCIISFSFAVLITMTATSFFKPGRGIRQGCPLSPLLFLLVAEGLSRAILKVESSGHFKGIRINRSLGITHLLFLDDVLLFCDGTLRDGQKLSEIMDIYCKASGMLVKLRKSTISYMGIREKGKVFSPNYFLMRRLICKEK